ncbi:MAG: hypothetical protein ACN6P2_08740 [Pseudomonas palmensis]|uniref:hypothetical protein n=1 Tax=Pseudomonas palmensis TaxID=2815362 RepID=UPI003D1157D6
MRKHVLKHFHLCCGQGGGAKGFNKSNSISDNPRAEWQCIGSVGVPLPLLALIWLRPVSISLRAIQDGAAP